MGKMLPSQPKSFSGQAIWMRISMARIPATRAMIMAVT